MSETRNVWFNLNPVLPIICIKLC